MPPRFGRFAFTETSMPENTDQKQGTRFKPGQSGNPAGRPKGSKHKIQEAFLRDFLTVWEEGGIDAIRTMARDDPSAFVRVAGNLLPKEEEHRHAIVGVRLWTEAEWLAYQTTQEINSEAITQDSSGTLSQLATDWQADD
jgi:Family of unknown function (DUF5681)